MHFGGAMFFDYSMSAMELPARLRSAVSSRFGRLSIRYSAIAQDAISREAAAKKYYDAMDLFVVRPGQLAVGPSNSAPTRSRPPSFASIDK
jgi:hypothetical protein